jgi:chemotaxis protein CheD
MRIIVSVSEMKIRQKNDRLVTRAPGSWLGLMVYEPVAQIVGLLQAMLPSSKINVSKAALNLFMFVDTGIPVLFEALDAQGGTPGKYGGQSGRLWQLHGRKRSV